MTKQELENRKKELLNELDEIENAIYEATLAEEEEKGGA